MKGKLTEQMLEATHEEYRLRKLAVVRNVPRAFVQCGESHYRTWEKKLSKMVARTGDGKPLVRMKSDVDFIGILKGGKAIKFDAKEVGNGVSIGLDRFEQHQVRSGIEYQQMGGFGGFIVHFVEQKKCFWIDAKTVDEMQWQAQLKRRNKSINISEFKHEIPFDGRRIDWIKAGVFNESN